MELLHRYRNLTVLLGALLVQLLLVAYQVRTRQDIPLIRVWAVSIIDPPGRAIHSVRAAAARWWSDYVFLSGARQENRRLRAEVDRLKWENRHLRQELATAERAQALAIFRTRFPSQTVAARVIGAASGLNSRVVFVDQGASAGVKTGMAVVNAEGLVGKVTAAYPSTSQVMLLTAEGFSAGVISGRTKLQGIVKGLGRDECGVFYIHSDEDVQPGDWFYTTGEDRVFPRGLPVGRVKSAGGNKVFKDILLTPAALARGIEEVLIVTAAVHQQIPEEQPVPGSAPLLPPPSAPLTSAPAPASGASPPPTLDTDADKLFQHYRKSAEARGIPLGENDAASRQAPSPTSPRPPAPVKP